MRCCASGMVWVYQRRSAGFNRRADRDGVYYPPWRVTLVRPVSRAILAVAGLITLFGCASVGAGPDGEGEGEGTDVPASPDEDGATADTGIDIPLPDHPDEGDEPDIPLPDDVGAEDADVDPDGDWICDDAGEIVDEFSCDWTWTCDAGSYVISCQLAGTIFNCTCKTPSGLPSIFSSEELCTAPNTINVANALCKWKLPVL